MKYSDAKEEIKNRVSIVEVIKEYVPLKRSGTNYIGLCPFHADKNPSMSVNESMKIFKCFACNEGGDVFHFLSKYLNISYYEAVLRLAKTVNIEIDNDYSNDTNYKKLDEKKQMLYALHKDLANIYYKCLHSEDGLHAYNYLKNQRKLTDKTILKFGLGYAPKNSFNIYNNLKKLGYNDELLIESTLFKLNEKNNVVPFFYDRIIFPVIDINNNIIGFQSRTLNPDEKRYKYLNSKSTIVFKKDSILYAYNFAFKSFANYYILCEGNMDAITLYQAGFDNVIAAQGTSFNENHIFLLKRKPKKIYLCQDMDLAGIKAKNKIADMLAKSGFDTYVIDINPVKDVDEFINDKNLGLNEFNKRLEKPIPSILYYVSTAKIGLNLNDPYDYEKYINLVVEKLSSIKSQIIREKYIKDTAMQENIDANTLLNMVNNHLKGNVSYKNLSNDYSNDKIEKNENAQSISKNEETLINIAFLYPQFKEDIIKSVDVNELNNPICRLLYEKFIANMKIDEIYNYIDTLDDTTKDMAKSILNSNYRYDDSTTENLINTLNVVIRNIKIDNLNNNNNNSLDNVFEANMKIKAIQNENFIK